MTNTTFADEVLKSDTLGRVHTPKARREALLEEFERSGVSGKKFAAMVGVNYQTFASWVQKRSEARRRHTVAVPQKPMIDVPASEALRLVEAVIADDHVQEAGASEPSLCVRLPGIRLAPGHFRVLDSTSLLSIDATAVRENQRLKSDAEVMPSDTIGNLSAPQYTA